MHSNQDGGQPRAVAAAPSVAQQTPQPAPSHHQSAVPTLLTSGSCMHRLQQFLSNCEAHFKDQLTLLSAACGAQHATEPARDLVFLFCQQIVCLAFTDTDKTPPEMWQIPNMGPTLELLLRILVPLPRDGAAGKCYLDYFSKFPAPFATSSQWNQFPAVMTQTIRFIHRFSESHDSFIQGRLRAQRLPLLEDIAGFFQVGSRGLQSVISRWFMTDHCQVPANDAGMVQHAPVFRQSLRGRNAFLQPQHSVKRLTRQQQHPQQQQYPQQHPQQHVQQYTQQGPQYYQQYNVQQYPLPSPQAYQYPQQQFQPNCNSFQQPNQLRQSVSMPSGPVRTPSAGDMSNQWSLGSGPSLRGGNTRTTRNALVSVPSRAGSAGNVNDSAFRPPVTQTNRPILASSMTPKQASGVGPRTSSTPTVPTEMTRFFPEAGVHRGQAVPAEPSKFALHQAHLATPRLVTKHLAISPLAEKERAYRYVHGSALEPRRFPSNERIITWNFHVSEQDAGRKPSPMHPTLFGEYPPLQVGQDTKTFRLRCTQDCLATEDDSRAWPTKDTHWPSDLFFECNGEMLEERRKLGHGKDLPIDITRFVKAGSNEIRMISNMDNKAPVTIISVAVEIVVVESHNKIKQDCMKRTVPRNETLTAINAGMQSEDEDLQLTFATIGLRDPMLGSRIWDIPMRGLNCRHREVWDLETFLNSRGHRPGDEVSMTDVWRCPICKEDARPSVIMVDEWMLDVRKGLEKMGQLDARSIRVEADGSWTVVEASKDQRSASRAASRRSEGVKSPNGLKPTPQINVIELDDEDT